MFKGLAPADASTAYRRVLQSIAAYLDEMEVPKSIIESMIATGSSEIRWVNSRDDGLERPPSIAEWEDASCGSHVNFDEVDTTSIAESKKYSEQIACVERLFSGHRARLAPP